MLRLVSLSSGSCGNAVFIEDGSTRLLVDAGTTLKYLGTALEQLDTSLDEIDAILLTHEHGDHIRSAAAVSRRFSVPVYANAATLDALPESFHKAQVRVFPTARTFEIGDFSIEAVPHSHDCREPVGFVFHNQGRKACVATDLGEVTNEVRGALLGADVIVLEANHDPGMLARSRYPRYLKKRIAGRQGHLSNAAAADVLVETASGARQQVLLAHLSEENNDARVALGAVQDTLARAAVDSLEVHIAPRLTLSPIIVA